MEKIPIEEAMEKSNDNLDIEPKKAPIKKQKKKKEPTVIYQVDQEDKIQELEQKVEFLSQALFESKTKQKEKMNKLQESLEEEFEANYGNKIKSLYEEIQERENALKLDAQKKEIVQEIGNSIEKQTETIKEDIKQTFAEQYLEQHQSRSLDKKF